MNAIHVAGLLASALVVVPTGAQALIWPQLAPLTSPSARNSHAMAYDAARQRVVLFGGNTSLTGVYVGDTWQWNGVNWLQSTPSASPVPREGHAMTYDSVRQQVVLFGGRTQATTFGDTWEWNGSSWAARFSVHIPSPRSYHALAYDDARQRVVLFAGLGIGAIPLAETWEWDGTDWTQLTPAQSPPPRLSTAMTYDAARQRVVLFGGSNGSGLTYGDTWEWDGSNWAQSASVTSPPALQGHAMTYDAMSQRAVLFGSTGVGLPGITWQWNGINWTQFAPPSSPMGRAEHAMTYDAARQRVVLFGGRTSVLLGDTWVRGTPPSQASAIPFGTGCGSPPLGFLPDATGRPVLGQVGSATIVNAPTNIAGVAMGWNNQFFGPFPLPVTLAGIGMPGCDLLQSSDLIGLGVSPLAPSTLSFSIAIPNVPGLLGTHVYIQAYALAPAVNPLQVIISNGIDWRFGNIGASIEVAITENFDNDIQLDRDSSAGTWAGGTAVFAPIGGDGRHGTFDVSLGLDLGVIPPVTGKRTYQFDTDNTIIPAASTTTGSAIAVTDGRFYFDKMVVPIDVRLRFIGSNPPVFTVMGRLDIQGEIDVQGQSLTAMPLVVPVPGQPGGAGGIFGGAGGQGGEKCSGIVAATSGNNGRNGFDGRMVGGHAYFTSVVGTGGRGSTVFPSTGLNSSLFFGTTTGLAFCVSASAGGGGGGFLVPGSDGRVVFNNHGSPPPLLSQMGPLAPGGSALQLFPFPVAGAQRSSLHFLVGGAGGGGSASNAALCLNLVPSWAPGAGGGGGGGAIGLRAGDMLQVASNGSVLAAGGSAAHSPTGIAAGPQCAPAGGGSGGSMVLQSGRLAQLTGLLDVRGGQGGQFNRSSSPPLPPAGANVQIAGGNGAPGFVRFEMPTAPTPGQLAGMLPPATATNVGTLAETDDLVGCRSTFYSTGLLSGPTYLRYEVHAIVGGVPAVFSDDPGVSMTPAQVGAPVRILLQAADLDLTTGQPLQLRPWRTSVISSPGQIGIATDGLNGFRFMLVVDRTVAPQVVVDKVVVVYSI